MAELYGLLVAFCGGDVAAESFDVVLYEGFEMLDGGAGEVGIEDAAKRAVIGVGAGVLDIS